MNPLLNPFNSFALLKIYLVDPDRLKKSSIEEIKRYRDKSFRKYIKYAYYSLLPEGLIKKKCFSCLHYVFFSVFYYKFC